MSFLWGVLMMNDEYIRLLDNLHNCPKDVDELIEELCDMFQGLDEGSGVITNTIGLRMIKGLRSAAGQVSKTKDVGRKCDIIANAISLLGGMVLVSIAVSGDNKSLAQKAMSLLSVGSATRKR